jgi:undecaprenyl diphosphate synthase
MHVAIIMDGNGRWAARRGLQRSAGHQVGARAVRRVVEAAARSPVDVLTLYAFSADNWCRPSDEVDKLMRLLERYLHSETARCVGNGVRVKVIGRRDRLDGNLLRSIEQTERMTADCSRLTLQLAIDYSARDALARAAVLLAERHDIDGRELCARFAQNLARACHSSLTEPAVDLLIRTGGERRLSDFLLWECAYAELIFIDDLWPDFGEESFAAALSEYYRRERRFGGLPARQATRIGEAP